MSLGKNSPSMANINSYLTERSSAEAAARAAERRPRDSGRLAIFLANRAGRRAKRRYERVLDISIPPTEIRPR